MLRLTVDVYRGMVGHCYDGLPLEACGLLAGVTTPSDASATMAGESISRRGPTSSLAAGHPFETVALDPSARAVVCYRLANAAASSRVYSLQPLEHLRAERDAEGQGLEILGVFHSHTHTDAYPSPTDVAQAPDPGWHYVLVSLRSEAPVVRSYLIRDGKIQEEPVVLE